MKVRTKYSVLYTVYRTRSMVRYPTVRSTRVYGIVLYTQRTTLLIPTMPMAVLVMAMPALSWHPTNLVAHHISTRALQPYATIQVDKTEQDQPKPRSATEHIEFPRPLTALERLQRQLTFSFQVLPVIGSYLQLYSTFQLRERLLNQCLSDEECEVRWDEEHERGATVVAKAFKDLKVRASHETPDPSCRRLATRHRRCTFRAFT